MRASIWLVGLLSGCSFAPSGIASNDGGRDGALPDAAADTAPIDGVGPCVSYSKLFDTCQVNRSGNADLVVTTNAKYNTDQHTLSLSGGATLHPAYQRVTTPTGPLEVLTVGAFSLMDNATLRVEGSIPFGIAATADVHVDGIIDASQGGAGARSAAGCGTSKGDTGCDGTLACGGGGGGFHGKGGGGRGKAVPGGAVAGGAGGTDSVRPAALLGGCSGGTGGSIGPGAATGGAGGLGGGAVAIATPNAIDVKGAINVGGAGGGGGQPGTGGSGGEGGEGGQSGSAGGGGGGGSGGMIVLECKSLAVTGAIAANGGGGGEGATEPNNNNHHLGIIGMPGDFGKPTSTRASGGSGNGSSGNGGSGGAVANNDGATAGSGPYKGGGGGGGGATGYIAIACGPLPTTGTLSPAAASWP